MEAIYIICSIVVFVGLGSGCATGFCLGCNILKKKKGISDDDQTPSRLNRVSSRNRENALTKQMCEKTGQNYNEMLEKQRKNTSDAYRKIK